MRFLIILMLLVGCIEVENVTDYIWKCDNHNHIARDEAHRRILAKEYNCVGWEAVHMDDYVCRVKESQIVGYVCKKESQYIKVTTSKGLSLLVHPSRIIWMYPPTNLDYLRTPISQDKTQKSCTK